jgi:hypothetical protein
MLFLGALLYIMGAVATILWQMFSTSLKPAHLRPLKWHEMLFWPVTVLRRIAK